MSNTNVDQTGDLLFYSIRQSNTPDREIACVQANEWEKIEPPLLDELLCVTNSYGAMASNHMRSLTRINIDNNKRQIHCERALISNSELDK